MKNSKLIFVLLAFYILGIIVGTTLTVLRKNKNENRQKASVSMDIGKLLFINTIVKHKDKDRKYIDSVYNSRKDSILNKVYDGN